MPLLVIVRLVLSTISMGRLDIALGMRQESSEHFRKKCRWCSGLKPRDRTNCSLGNDVSLILIINLEYRRPGWCRQLIERNLLLALRAGVEAVPNETNTEDINDVGTTSRPLRYDNNNNVTSRHQCHLVDEAQMDIFSLISVDTNLLQDPKEVEEVDAKFIDENGSKLSGGPRLLNTSSPRRPTNHVDERIRMKQCSKKLFADDDDDDDGGCFVSTTPDTTPHSSPSKNDLLSTSPVQHRLERAATTRQRILMERVLQIDNKSKEKEQLAYKRKEVATIERVIKARTNESINLVKSKRKQLLEDRVREINIKSKHKETEAIQRKENHLLEKQRRACRKERIERADQRRVLISYERRAKLLSTLNDKHERAAVNSHRLNEEKSIKAGEDIIKAKEVARKVKACRKIQELVRVKYCIHVISTSSSTGGNGGGKLVLSEDSAAVRLQQWYHWRAHVCKRRLFAMDDAMVAGSAPIKALEALLDLFFPLNQIIPPSFDHLSQLVMMDPNTIKMANQIVYCFHPLMVDSGGSKSMDGRTLLALFLIAVHPSEVLGSDFDVMNDRKSRGARPLVDSANDLLTTLGGHYKENFDFHTLHKLLNKTAALFAWWKRVDMEEFLDVLSKQLEQSWIVYLTSCETLQYLSSVTKENDVKESNDDPMYSLRIRHEAGRAGSRAHIKRIRISLNKLVGDAMGKELVTKAKEAALKQIETSNVLKELTDEVDEIRKGPGSSPSSSAQGVSMMENLSGEMSLNRDGTDLMAMVQFQGDRRLVHSILLTDAKDFHKLSWDGSLNAQQPNASPEEFMAAFSSQAPSVSGLMDNVPTQIAQSMKMAFFNLVAQEMGQGSYNSVRELMKELHNKMRSLLPNRNDLHSHLSDDEIAACSTVSDVTGVLIRSGSLLANYLESTARASSTRELIECLSNFKLHPDDVIPYGIETENMFVVASVAYILYKAELCQSDIRNFELSRVAPLLYTEGNEYERKHFKSNYGDYTSVTNEELHHMIPATWIWVKAMQLSTSTSNGENSIAQSNLDQKFEVLKGNGFVDGLLFARSPVALPEVFSLDVENIDRIRRDARCCVIASALALHACNISRVRSTSSDVASEELIDARRRLSSVLRKSHFDEKDLEQSVIDAVGTLTKAMAERDLSEDEIGALRNHSLAVLNGNDPVLKLLDNRVQSFFRYVCKWKSTRTILVPLDIRTGRSTLSNSDDVATRQCGIPSTKDEFYIAAKKEALRLGFADFCSELIDAGKEARGIVNLACVNYGDGILDRFLCAASDL